jgi:hypothetical protein
LGFFSENEVLGVIEQTLLKQKGWIAAGILLTVSPAALLSVFQSLPLPCFSLPWHFSIKLDPCCLVEYSLSLYQAFSD